MTLPPRVPSPARPDLADRLLAAVAERDLPMADRLVQQWVHRRGLAALEALIAGRLLASQGAEAARWLQGRAQGDPLEGESLGGEPLGGEPIRDAVTELEPTMQPEPESVSRFVEQGLEPVVKQRVEPAVQVISHPVWQETACEELQEASVPEAVPAAILSQAWPQLAVVPDGEPAPAPRALAPLRAWLPDANLLPLAS